MFYFKSKKMYIIIPIAVIVQMCSLYYSAARCVLYNTIILSSRECNGETYSAESGFDRVIIL